jgi:hypothetical protein
MIDAITHCELRARIDANQIVTNEARGKKAPANPEEHFRALTFQGVLKRDAENARANGWSITLYLGSGEAITGKVGDHSENVYAIVPAGDMMGRNAYTIIDREAIIAYQVRPQ